MNKYQFLKYAVIGLQLPIATQFQDTNEGVLINEL